MQSLEDTWIIIVEVSNGSNSSLFGVVFAITFHVLTHRRMGANKKKLYVVSLVLAIVCSAIPTTGENNSDFSLLWCTSWNICLLWRMGIFVSSIRFSFNFILFYFVLNVLFKIRKSSGREVKNRRICIAELAIRLGTASRIFYMAGKYH